MTLFSAPMSKSQRNNRTNPEPIQKTAKKISIKQTSQTTVIMSRFFDPVNVNSTELQLSMTSASKNSKLRKTRNRNPYRSTQLNDRLI